MNHRRSNDGRPRIWAEGRQHPPFDARAYALASVRFAREGLSGLLSRCAHSADGLAGMVASGSWRVPPHRLGRTGRYLPSHRSLARAIGAGAAVLAEAGRGLLSTAAPVPAPSSLFAAPPAAPAAPARPDPSRRAVPTPVPTRTPEAAGPDSDPADDLAALRALLAEVAPPAPPAPPALPAPLAMTGAAAQHGGSAIAPSAGLPGTGWRRSALLRGAALTLGFGLLVVSVPYGALRAAIAHLNGQDLRDISAAA